MWKRIQEARLSRLTIHGLKNVLGGVLDFYSPKDIRDGEISQTDGHVFGIYGPNGSGKTTAVDACKVLKDMLSGYSPDSPAYQETKKRISRLINKTEKEASIEAEFYFSLTDIEYIVSYGITIQSQLSGDEKEKCSLVKESLAYRYKDKTRWSKFQTLADIDIPRRVYSIQGLSPEQNEDLLRTALTINELAPLSSLIFTKSAKEHILDRLKNGKAIDLLDVLSTFNEHYFIVVDNHDLTTNVLGVLLLVVSNERSDLSSHGKLPIFTDMFSESRISTAFYPQLVQVASQISDILSVLVPGLRLQIEQLDEVTDKDGYKWISYEAMANRNGVAYSLVCESEGIKRLISVISVLIAFVTHCQTVLIIDEFDAGIFEFLFGEMIEALHETGRGQLIFTAHNLRGLEVLPYKQVFFSTLNPSNVYERQNSVMQNNNKRTTYFRNLVLGKEKGEVLGDLPSVAKLKSSFRKSRRFDEQE